MAADGGEKVAAAGDRIEQAMLQARLGQSAHIGAVAEQASAAHLRLAQLRDDLLLHVHSHAGARNAFSVSLVSDLSPRLWLDHISYVIMAPSPQSYRLVEDRRDGPHTLFESQDRDAMLDKLISFLANRLIERERAMALPVAEVSGRVRRFGLGALVVSWLCGLLLGVVGLFLVGVWLGGGP